jgi:hypothetical protein
VQEMYCHIPLMTPNRNDDRFIILAALFALGCLIATIWKMLL